MENAYVRHFVLIAIVLLSKQFLSQIKYPVMNSLANLLQLILNVPWWTEVRNQRMHVNLVGAPIILVFLRLLNFLFQLVLLTHQIIFNHLDIFDHTVHAVKLIR